MKVFLTTVAVFMVLLGSAWLFLPGSMIGSWSVQTDATGVYIGRRYGSLLLGYAAILWLARTTGPSPARVAILGGGAFVTALITLISVAGVLTGTIGPGAWITVAIEAVLAAGFLYFFMAERRQIRGEASS